MRTASDRFDDWLWADGDFGKSAARVALTLVSSVAVVAGAIWAFICLPWWVTYPPSAWGLTRGLLWTLR